MNKHPNNRSEAAKVREKAKRDKLSMMDAELTAANKKFKSLKELYFQRIEEHKREVVFFKDEIKRIEHQRDAHAAELHAKSTDYRQLMTGVKLIAISGIIMVAILATAIGWLYAQS
jgi:hypothetical protein